MDDKKIIKIHNKSDKPDNIVFKENVLIERCIKVENKLPKFMKDYHSLDFLESEESFNAFYENAVVTEDEKHRILIKTREENS